MYDNKLKRKPPAEKMEIQPKPIKAKTRLEKRLLKENEKLRASAVEFENIRYVY